MLCTSNLIIKMEIVPVIYILEGKAVALYKGHIDQKEVYGKTPTEYAKQFVKQGAKIIYLVDLDASEFLNDRNLPILKEIRKKIDVKLMCAGGIRTMDKVKRCFDMGMDYVVLGVSAEDIYKESIETYGPDKVIVGIKAKGDEVITDKKMKFPLRVIELAEQLPDYGVKQVLYKDLWKESTMIGPNYDEPDRILQMTNLEVYYSGGIGEKNDLETLKRIGVKGAMIGKALYERKLNLRQIIGNY